MKIRSTLAAAMLALPLLVSTLSHADTASVPLIQTTLQSELMFRGWDTKSFSEETPHDIITVITDSEFRSDIVILRWNDGMAGYTTEVYRQEHTEGPHKVWATDDSGKEKSITIQPGSIFFISEEVPGKEGGRRIEKFKLK